MGSPPSWSSTYFYVVNQPAELLEPFESLRCLHLSEREVRRSTRKIRLADPFEFSLYVAACLALDTPSGYVVPWEIRVGAITAASLHPPPWVVYASDIGQGSVSLAVARVSPEALAQERDLRMRHVERAMRSASLLDHIRRVRGRRMTVQWFEGDRLWRQDSLDSGADLFDALTDSSTRNRAHLIHFPDGWYVNGLDWLT
ncbi:MAG: hypothetical protein Q7V57_14190 [Actinomycetota bacterium]|nr:hypothetical protein [Actinomycetota bacterium]